MGNVVPKSPQTQILPPLDHQQQPQQQQQQEEAERRKNEEEELEFTCEICIEPAAAERKFRNSDKCGHPFCEECVIKYIRVEVEEKNEGRIKCPAVGCPHHLDPLDCAAAVGPLLLVRWCDVLCEAAILGLERCYCPNLRCSELIVNECGGIATRSTCPNCKDLFCFHCKTPWHAGFVCEDTALPMDANDVAFGRLVEHRNWKRCPRCRHFVELMEGCPIVRCRCGSSFCYRCEVVVDRPWCRCMTTSLRHCRLWCYRVCILVIVFNLALFFLLWGINKHKRMRK